MSLEPWELSDEQIWGEVDYAALIEAFRRSEISEERERRYSRAEFGLNLDVCLAFAQAVSSFTRSVCEASAALQRCLTSFSAFSPARVEARRSRPRGPRTAPDLQAALLARPTFRISAPPAQRQHRRQHR